MADPTAEVDVDATMSAILSAFRRIRMTKVGLLEHQLVEILSSSLSAAGIEHSFEVVIGPRCRIDIAVPVGPNGTMVGVEVKKARPRLALTSRQVARYAATGQLSGLVLVAERAFDLPMELAHIPVAAISLQSNLGIAL